MNAIFSVIIPVFLPFVFAAASFIRGRKDASGVLLGGAFFHLAATVFSFFTDILPVNDGIFFPRGAHKLYSMLEMDGDSRIILLLISVLFLLSSFYFVRHDRRMKSDGQNPLFRQSVYCAAMLAFLGSMALVLAARNLGLLWVAIEATTLFSAPLIIYYRTARAVEAMWKYLLICSVGIGFALFGTLLIACSVPGGNAPGLSLDLLGQMELNPLLFKAGFVFILAGYGTKADLAPFHNWIPDTYSEAYGPASALISGTLLNASFIGIVRILDIAPDGAAVFCKNVLMTLGFLSIAVAAFFVIRQYDSKRMLGYSSIEHMGLAMLMQVSGLHTYAMCHLICHAFFKSGLFMTAENIRLRCNTRRIDGIRGLLADCPLNAVLLAGGLIMICGMPPSPLFFTEFALISKLSDWKALLLIFLLFLIFAGMLHAALRMVSGKARRDLPVDGKNSLCIEPVICILSAISGGVLYFLTTIS